MSNPGAFDRDDVDLALRLREALSIAATAATIGSPSTHRELLDLIVRTSASVISAKAGTLFLIDDRTDELVTEVAMGEKAAEVSELRMPLGHGIAGLVAVSGQPMVVSDVASNPKHAADVAERIGYYPDSILCVPLFYRDRIIGVLELLDKEGAPSFAPEDIDALSLFANQAAVAIEQSRIQQSIGELVSTMLDGGRDRLQEHLEGSAGRLSEDAAFRRSIELAALVNEIAGQGDAEAEACAEILHAFARYKRRQPLAESE